MKGTVEYYAEQFQILTGLSCSSRIRMWIEEMDKDPCTSCILYNFFEGEKKCNNLNLKHLVEFFNRLDRYLEMHPTLPLKPEDLISKLADQHEALYVKGVTKITRPDRLSRITRLASFVHYNLGQHAPMGDNYWDEKQAELIISGDYSSADLSGTLRGDRPFCWVTKYEELKSVTYGNHGDELATRLRNGLGLVHYGKDAFMVEIEYPENFSHAVPIAVPTVLDAGNRPVFRPWKTTDGWGRAIDLETFAPGLCEAVHKEYDLDKATDKISFSFRYVGKVLDTIDDYCEKLLAYLHQDV